MEEKLYRRQLAKASEACAESYLLVLYAAPGRESNDALLANPLYRWE